MALLMSFGTYISFLLLAVIQGLTEWLPISSSGILVVLEDLINLKNKNLNLLFNISVHTGSLLAVIIYFKKEIFNLIGNNKLLQNIFIATIPVVILGFIVKIFNFNIFLQDAKIVGISTIAFSILLYLADKTKVSQKFENSISNKNSFIIGLCQAIAIIPGTSRSGITITAARYLGFSRLDSAKFSFLISIPTLLAATVLGASDAAFNFDNDVILILVIGLVFSFIASMSCIKLFLKFVENNSLTIFVIIRIVLGFCLLVYLAN